jgi:hypothetical protein
MTEAWQLLRQGAVAEAAATIHPTHSCSRADFRNGAAAPQHSGLGSGQRHPVAPGVNVSFTHPSLLLVEHLMFFGSEVRRSHPLTAHPGKPMRCYFNLVSSHQTLVDDDGVEVADWDRARALALEVAAERIRAGVSEIAHWRGWRLTAQDSSGAAQFTIDLDAALTPLLSAGNRRAGDGCREPVSDRCRLQLIS